MLTDVVLPFEPGTASEREVASLAAQAPEHTASASVDLVGRPRVPCGDDQMPVRCDVNRVDVEVVEPGARLRLDLRLCDSDMVEAVPFPEEATARQRQLLDDPADDAAARASADRSQV